MKTKESKAEAFKRLATKRTNRILKDVSLLGNLSDKGNYAFDELQVRKIFSAVDRELKQTKARFEAAQKSERRIKL